MLSEDMQFNPTLAVSSTFILVMIGYTAFYPHVFATTGHHGDQDGDQASEQDTNKKRESTRSADNGSTSQIKIRGDQIIYCEGDLTSCHNLLTNIICSNVKYCIVGEITPFLMSNPL
jgi:hypothetical protein